MKKQWKLFNELRKVDKNYSGLNYSYEMAERLGILEDRYLESFVGKHTVGVNEKLEICLDEKGRLLYRLVEKSELNGINKEFNTQFGVFVNNNQGEFGGELITSAGVRVNGNFVDAVDYENRVYVIDSLKHLGVAHFRLLEFTGAKKYRDIYRTKDIWEDIGEYESLQFGALYEAEDALYILISGYISQMNKKEGKNREIACTKLLRVRNSNVYESVQLNETFYGVRNMIIFNNSVYVAMDKMVVRINMKDGMVSYYTHISELAEIDLLVSNEQKGN